MARVAARVARQECQACPRAMDHPLAMVDTHPQLDTAGTHLLPHMVATGPRRATVGTHLRSRATNIRLWAMVLPRAMAVTLSIRLKGSFRPLVRGEARPRRDMAHLVSMVGRPVGHHRRRHHRRHRRRSSSGSPLPKRVYGSNTPQQTATPSGSTHRHRPRSGRSPRVCSDFRLLIAQDSFKCTVSLKGAVQLAQPLSAGSTLLD